MKSTSTSPAFRDIGANLSRTLLAIVALWLVGETMLLTPLAGQLPAPSFGTPLRQLDLKLAALDAQLAREGRVSCIIIGSSMPLLGLDPAALETGLGKACFNFGLNGMSAAGAQALTEILVVRYQPDLIIYGIEMRAFAALESASQWRILVIPSPWLEYTRGTITLDGWLVAHSRLYRQILAFSFWAEPLAEWWVTPLSLQNYQDFEPAEGQTIDVTQPLSEEEMSQREIVVSLQNYSILAEEWEAFEQLAQSIQGTGTRLVIVEMPVHDSFLLYLGRGAADHAAFTQLLADYSVRHDILFIPTFGVVDLPPAVWLDRNHLNRTGAREFSTWLGTQMRIQIEATP